MSISRQVRITRSAISPRFATSTLLILRDVVLFDDDLLFISWYQAGVQLIDISEPANPVLLGGFDTFPGAVAGHDGNWGVYPLLGLDRVLASDLDGGLFILDVEGLVARPVPALGTTALWLLSLGILLAATGVLRRPAYFRRYGKLTRRSSAPSTLA